MKPFIGYDIKTETWAVQDGGKHYSNLTPQQLNEQFGISNPVLYCEQWRKEHAKPAGNVR